MDRRTLGETGIEVSRLCYGTLTLSRFQAALSPQEGGELIAYAARSGVDFVDTAELYDTYKHVNYALKHTSVPLVISTKSYAYDKKSAQESVEKARREMDVDVIDLFMLHEQENTMTMLGHMEALDYYFSMKDKGVIRAVGISTHAIEPVQAVAQARYKSGGISKQDSRQDSKQDSKQDAKQDANQNAENYTIKPFYNNKDHWIEFDPGRYRELDVIHPILNCSGIGLLDGTAEQMREAVEAAHNAGVGIFGMKMLGGGNLFNEFDEAVAYALALDAADAYAVGMQSKAEIDMNIALFENRPVSEALLTATKSRKRKLLIEDWCVGCRACVVQCKAGALDIFEGKARVDTSKCVLCSYCARACRDFAIKVI